MSCHSKFIWALIVYSIAGSKNPTLFFPLQGHQLLSTSSNFFFFFFLGGGGGGGTFCPDINLTGFDQFLSGDQLLS